MNPEQAFQRLAHAGIVAKEGRGWRTTPLWDRALMRAEAKVMDFGEQVEDPRLPIGYALVDILGARIPEPELESLVEALLPLEVAEEQAMEPEEVEDLDEDLEDLEDAEAAGDDAGVDEDEADDEAGDGPAGPPGRRGPH